MQGKGEAGEVPGRKKGWLPGICLLLVTYISYYALSDTSVRIAYKLSSNHTLRLGSFKKNHRCVQQYRL